MVNTKQKDKNGKITTVLVTGADGMVGTYINRVFSPKKYRLVLTGKKQMDVTNRKQVHNKIRRHKPDLIIHLAAKTNVDECETNPKETFKVNFEGAKNVAVAAKAVDAIFVYVGTSAVFDGKRDKFLEHDKQNPVNLYGRSKAEAEKYIHENIVKYYTIRAGWMIGGGKKEKKFISYIIDQANKNMPMKVVNDKFGTITYAYELITFIKDLFEKRAPFGIYHYGSRGVCSRYDIAKKILSIIGKKLPVTPVSSKEFALKFSAPRPKYEVIATTKGKFPYTWSQSLKNYITNEII